MAWSRGAAVDEQRDNSDFDTAIFAYWASPSDFREVIHPNEWFEAT
jgi:hypothetical protein